MKHIAKTGLFTFGAFIVILFSSCMERTTDDPIETYKLWSGALPEKNIQVIHGKYWRSGHWSKEYIMYLELKAPSLWRTQFVKQNNLVEPNKSPEVPSDAPTWFTPGNNFRTFTPAGVSQGSIYYKDTLTGEMFIYEIQL